MSRCPVCDVRVGPCVDEHGNALPSHHVERTIATVRGVPDHAAEATRLRQERTQEMRRIMAARKGSGQ